MFSPSAHFNEHWLASPDAIKNVIYDELHDIIALLKGKTSADKFTFTTPDVATTLHHLQTAHLQTLKQLRKQLQAQKAQSLLPVLEQAIDDKLSQKTDALADELKIWLQQLVDEKLAQMD